MIIKVESLDHNGRGIARINNKVTFINNALPNELIDIIITEEKKKYSIASIKKIIEKSENRIEPQCPYYNECGGCNIMHMNYESQINFKKEKVEDILKKYAKIDIDLKVNKSNKPFNYRNKITLHKEKQKLGYMKRMSNDIINIDNCPLAMETINEYITSINNNNIEKEIIIRTNEKGEIISTLKDETIIMEINELKFQIDINSFFQVNNYICAQLFNYVEENLENNNTCLDLYSGVGTLSIIASKKAKKVYAIEINENAHKNSLVNLKLNNITNVEFILGNVNKKIKQIKEKIDVIITDPPRSGMDKITIETILKYKPKKIIYISCNPITLARDLNTLTESYYIEKCAIFDMFPNTYHVECVCVLNRR